MQWALPCAPGAQGGSHNIVINVIVHVIEASNALLTTLQHLGHWQLRPASVVTTSLLCTASNTLYRCTASHAQDRRNTLSCDPQPLIYKDLTFYVINCELVCII